MSIKNLLVAYNGSESSDAALRAAILMHQKYGAHITGLLAHQSAQSRLGEETWIPGELKKTLQNIEGSEHERIRQAFHSRADGAVAPDQLHWIEHFGSADNTVADYSLMYDVTIVGRHDALQGRERFVLHPDRIASRSGRPVLVVPREFDEKLIHEHAVLAWDGNRSATSALWAAMNILETKKNVTVLTVETRKLRPPLEGIDVKTVLERHGLRAEITRVPCKPEGVAQTLLDHCTGHGAGFLVMGAFQSSVFREELFGGVTKDVVSKSPVPVLIAH